MASLLVFTSSLLIMATTMMMLMMMFGGCDAQVLQRRYYNTDCTSDNDTRITLTTYQAGTCTHTNPLQVDAVSSVSSVSFECVNQGLILDMWTDTQCEAPGGKEYIDPLECHTDGSGTSFQMMCGTCPNSEAPAVPLSQYLITVSYYKDSECKNLTQTQTKANNTCLIGFNSTLWSSPVPVSPITSSDGNVTEEIAQGEGGVVPICANQNVLYLYSYDTPSCCWQPQLRTDQPYYSGQCYQQRPDRWVVYTCNGSMGSAVPLPTLFMLLLALFAFAAL